MSLVGVPVLFFVLAEGLLRTAGFGYSPRFFLRAQVQSNEVWTDNQEFARRFFPPELVRYPRPFTMPARKEPGTLRVFVMGESAAMGDPDARFGMPRMVEALLRERYPKRRLEVVNAAMVAINSHAILPIARDCAQREGDLWVIYMGNNEVIGPFGSASVFGVTAPPLGIIRAGLLAKESKVGQLADTAVDALRPQGSRPSEWGGMQMMAEVKVGPDSAGTLRVLQHFERNLNDILEAGVRADVPILLCTIATNLKDCAPFASLHNPALSESQLAEWKAAYEEGMSNRKEGKMAEAAAALERAYRIDPKYAEVVYLMAECALELGRIAEAAALFEKARDLDALQFRTDSRINRLIRKAAERFADRGVRLLDAEALFGKESPHRVPGSELFYEHVHLTPEGNYLLARAIAEEAVGLLQLGKQGEWNSREECLRSLGFREWNRWEALQTIRGLIQSPPFTGQLNHEREKQRIEEQIAALRTADKPAQVKRDVQRLTELVLRYPEDPDMRWNLAVVLEAAGAESKAEEQWRALVQMHPHAALPAINLAKLLERLGRAEEAIELYERGLGIQPRYYPARYALGLLSARVGQFAMASKHLELAVQQKPTAVDARVALADALARSGKTARALEHYQEVLRLDPANKSAEQGLKGLDR
jgi:tetratricopeptide (TPR) repeat protein